MRRRGDRLDQPARKASDAVRIHPCGTRPLAANLDYTTGQIVPNAVIAPVSPTGDICLYRGTDTDLIADIDGWFSTG